MQNSSALLASSISTGRQLSRYTGDVWPTPVQWCPQARRVLWGGVVRSQRQVAEYLTEGPAGPGPLEWRASMTMSKSWPNR